MDPWLGARAGVSAALPARARDQSRGGRPEGRGLASMQGDPLRREGRAGLGEGCCHHSNGLQGHLPSRWPLVWDVHLQG